MRREVSIRPNGSKRVQMHCTDCSRTRQEFKDECDLQKIIRRFSSTDEGMQALANAQGFISGRFEDVSSVPDYQTACNLKMRADAIFEALPAALRKRFDHDPGKFLDFVDDPANIEELKSLGLVKTAAEVPKSPQEAAAE